MASSNTAPKKSLQLRHCYPWDSIFRSEFADSTILKTSVSAAILELFQTSKMKHFSKLVKKLVKNTPT